MSESRNTPGDLWLVAASVRIYRLLVRGYPSRFQEEYGRDLVQLFRDCCREACRGARLVRIATFWGDALGDLAVGVARERSAELREGGKAVFSRRLLIGSIPYVLAILLGLSIGWVNVHTDETPFVALPLLAVTGILGLAQPRHAWRWALLVGVWLSLSQTYALLTSTRLPYPNGPSDIATVLGIGLVLGLVGAYAGALVGWFARRSTGQGAHPIE